MKFITKNGIIFVGLFLTGLLLYKYLDKRPLDGENNPFWIILVIFATLLVLLILTYIKGYISNKNKGA